MSKNQRKKLNKKKRLAEQAAKEEEKNEDDEFLEAIVKRNLEETKKLGLSTNFTYKESVLALER